MFRRYVYTTCVSVLERRNRRSRKHTLFSVINQESNSDDLYMTWHLCMCWCVYVFVPAPSLAHKILLHMHITHRNKYLFFLLGSSTACIVSLHREERTIYTANLGDSGFLIIRDGEVVHRSLEQQHYFNTPFQLAVAPPSQQGLVLSDRLVLTLYSTHVWIVY